MAVGSQLDENRVKHLELLQAVIGRLGNDSFLVKGWAITVAGAFIGFAVTSREPGLALASIIPTLLFWALDATYLRSERLFRVLYERVRQPQSTVEGFFMSATSPRWIESHIKGTPDESKASWWRTAKSASLALFYGALVLAALVMAALVSSRSEEPTPRYLAAEALPLERSADQGNDRGVGVWSGMRCWRPDMAEAVLVPARDEVKMYVRDGLLCRSTSRRDQVHSLRL